MTIYYWCVGLFVWLLASFVLLFLSFFSLLGFDPGRLSVFVNTLTMVSVLILLSGCMIRTVYIVGVWLIGAKHPMLQLKRLFFVTKKNFFFAHPLNPSMG